MKSFLVCLSMLLCFQAVAEIQFSPREVKPLGVGQSIPDAPLTKLDGSETTLREAIGGKPSILIFYRGGWCPYCMRHLSALKDVIPEVKEMGYEVIAISPDYLESAKKAAEENAIDYTILTDTQFEAIQAFKLAFELDSPTQEKLKSYDIKVKPVPGMPVYALPVPAVYVVDANGRIQFLYFNPDYTRRLTPEEILQEAKKHRAG